MEVFLSNINCSSMDQERFIAFVEKRYPFWIFAFSLCRMFFYSDVQLRYIFPIEEIVILFYSLFFFFFSFYLRLSLYSLLIFLFICFSDTASRSVFFFLFLDSICFFSLSSVLIFNILFLF